MKKKLLKGFSVKGIKPTSDGIALYSKKHTKKDWERIGKFLKSLVK